MRGPWTTDRRGFLGAAGAVAVGLTTRAGALPPSERVRLAVIGVRGRGRGLASGFAGRPDAEVATLCDVDARELGPVVAEVESRQGRPPATASDLRRVLDDPKIDAVVIATPDHWHALATVWACQAGKHVYVEKPASHNVAEGRTMVEAARKHDRVVQVGTQSRSAPGYVELIAFLRSGGIGRVHMAKAWNSQRRGSIGRKADGTIPSGVDYDLWLGPAPDRPFNENRFHSTWHWNWDYGTGDMGNDGVHDLDVARWGLGVDWPSSIAAVGGRLAYGDDDAQVPDTQVVGFQFPGAGAVLAYEQRLWSPYVQEGFENGVAFYGTGGYVLAGRAGWRHYGERNALVAEHMRPFSDEPHRDDFLAAIRDGRRPNADIEDGHRSAALAHLGNIAVRVGRRLAFDGATGTIADDPAASALLTRAYRAPFAMPASV